MLISSSGPLALAAGYRVPVLMSTAFHRAFGDAPGLFDLTTNALSLRISQFYDDARFREACQSFVDWLRISRMWPSVATQFRELYGRLSSREAP